MPTGFTGTFGELDAALASVISKKDILDKASHARDLADADYQKALSSAQEIKSKLNDLLNTLIPSTEGRVRQSV